MSSKSKAAEPIAEEKGGGKKKLVLILAVALVIAAGAGYFFLFSGGEAEAQAPVAGGVLALDSVAVNLAGGGYLKVGVALQLVESDGGGGHGGSTGPDGSQAKDIIIATFSQAQPADVTGAREALKTALEERIIEAYHGEVMGIYYTEYVTQ